VLFASKKYDISDDVLEQLGVKPGVAGADKEPDGGKSSDKTSKSQEKKSRDMFKPTNPEMRSANDRSQRNVMPPLGKTR
jgi:hypothetical protein